MSNPTKAIIYCRVSSERQVQEGHGLESQEQRCLEYAQKQGLTVVATFHDAGISGGLFDRPAMHQLIDFLDKNPSDKFVIIFDDLKRFARDVGVHLRLRTELLSRGVGLQCLNFNFEDTPEGRFVETVIAATAQLDREQNKRQVIQKMKARLSSGYWSFYPPPGLKYIQHPLYGKVLTADESYADIFKEALERFASGRLVSISQVRDFIQSHYQMQSINKLLSLARTKRLLSNPLYAGYIEYKPWNIRLHKAAHHGFISFTTYQKNQ